MRGSMGVSMRGGMRGDAMRMPNYDSDCEDKLLKGRECHRCLESTYPRGECSHY